MPQRGDADAGARARRRLARSAARALAGVVVAVLLGGCERPDTRHSAAATDSAAVAGDTAPGWSVDSALGRFRAGLARTDTLRHAKASPEALVRSFVEALGHGDTLALAQLHVSRSEFAWLVYPESRFARRPYRQPPELTWSLIIERSDAALARLLARRAGESIRYAGHTCDAADDMEGRSRYRGGCRVAYVTLRGDTVTERLFSSIIERDGRFKIGSYANQF